MADLSLLVVSLRGWGWLDVIMLVTMMMSRAHYQFYYCIPRPRVSTALVNCFGCSLLL